jgi:oligoendopeptidase F
MFTSAEAKNGPSSLPASMLMSVTDNLNSQVSGGKTRAAPACGPAWDLSSEYGSFDDPLFAEDRAKLAARIDELEALAACPALKLGLADSLDPSGTEGLVAVLRRSLLISDKISLLQDNLTVYVNCVLAVDGGDLRAKELKGISSALNARADAAQSAFDLFFSRASDEAVGSALADEVVQPHRFRISQLRKYRFRLLDLPEEKLLAAMRTVGFSA